MAKFKLNALRQLHAQLGGILEDYDTARAAEMESAKDDPESGDQPRGQDNPPEFSGKPADPMRASDSLLSDTAGDARTRANIAAGLARLSSGGVMPGIGKDSNR